MLIPLRYWALVVEFGFIQAIGMVTVISRQFVISGDMPLFTSCGEIDD